MHVAQEAIRAGLSSKPPPAVCDITGYHPNYFVLGLGCPPPKDRLPGFGVRWVMGPGISRVFKGLRASSASRELLAPGGLASLTQDLPRICCSQGPGPLKPPEGGGYIVKIWPTRVAEGRAPPPDVREEPGRVLYVHSP